MMGRQHITFGVITSVTTVLTLTEFQIIKDPYSSVSFCFMGSILLGTLLPDIDNPQSTIGHFLKPISFLLDKLFGHRSLTHDILFLSLLMAGSFYLKGFHHLNLYGLWFGIWGHIFLDMFTVYGVPACCLLKKDWKIHLLPKDLRCYCDSSAAKGITWACSILYVVITFFILNKFTGFTL